LHTHSTHSHILTCYPATSRVLVQKPIAEKFTEALKTAFAATEAALGSDPLDPATSFGPIVDKLQFDKIMSYIEIGKKTATLVTGGEQKGDKGFFIKPTIFLNPDPESPIVREEIFGPVMCIQTFETEEEVVALANGTEYGLAGASPFHFPIPFGTLCFGLVKEVLVS
jgi:aldehyde dehydrogenase (NAD+)